MLFITNKSGKILKKFIQKEINKLYGEFGLYIWFFIIHICLINYYLKDTYEKVRIKNSFYLRYIIENDFFLYNLSDVDFKILSILCFGL